MENKDDEQLRMEINRISKDIESIMEKIKNIVPSPQEETTESDD